MRLHFHTAVPAALALFALVSALSATVFLLNAGCLLLFAAVCIALRRADSRKRWQIPYRASSKFAR